MDNIPLITIFIPTYQRAHFLVKAIKSALNQTYRNIQVIVCDNASNDQTGEVAAQLAKKDSRLKYICHTENFGMLGNYQYALSHVKTKYFSFLSDDDILLPHFCQTALDGFSHYPNLGFFACSTISLSKEHGVICVPLDFWAREGWFSPLDGGKELIGKYPIPTTVLFRTEAALKAKIDFGNPLAWDCDFLIQLAGQFPFAISKKYCGLFIHHLDSYSGSQNTIAMIDSILKLQQRVRHFPWIESELKISMTNQLQKAIYDNSFAALRALFSKGQLQDVRNTCRYLLNNCPAKIEIIFYFLCTYFFISRFFRVQEQLPLKAKWKGFEKYRKWVNDL